MRVLRILGVVAVVATILVAASNTSIQAAPPAQTNLLKNPSFEGTFKQFAHFTTAIVAEQWLPWWKEQGGDDEPWQNRMPEYKPAAPYQSRIHSGNNAQQYFSYWGTHVGGIYQVVSGIAPGSKIRFVIWGQAWSGSGDDPSHSENPSPMHMRVGIDPNGGANPWSASIVWSAEQEPIDTWLSFAVEAQANADKVTVYRASNGQLYFFDDEGDLLFFEPDNPPIPDVVIQLPGEYDTGTDRGSDGLIADIANGKGEGIDEPWEQIKARSHGV